jgi:hypothetical protein
MVRIPEPLLAGVGGSPVHGWTVGGTFTPAEMALSSGAREILAILGGVTALDLRNGDVSWQSDATNAVNAISKWRTKSTAVAAILRDLWTCLLHRDVRVTMTHVFRDADLMPVADFLSRRAWREKQAEWRFPTKDIDKVFASLRIPRLQRASMIDMFASSRNAQSEVFCSRWMEPGSIGDAFAVDWHRPEYWWAFPPHSQAERLFLRLHHLSLSAVEAATSPTIPTVAPSAINVVIVYSPSRVSQQIVPSLASRDILLWSPTATASSHGLLPNIRLIGENGRAAPGPPPWSLRAAWIRLDHVT